MKLALIAAMGRNRVIGRKGALPWHLPDDLKHFKALTAGHHVVMGRKTWESLGRALPNRSNLVCSRQAGFIAAGCRVFSDLDAAIRFATEAGETELFVIGGAELYRAALNRADTLYLTVVDASPDGDAWFPEFDPRRFRETERRHHLADERHAHGFDICRFEREDR